MGRKESLLGSESACDNSIDFNDDDEDEVDVLREHQNLVKQMKVELKNCSRVIKGLPTISEELADEHHKTFEGDLKRFEFDFKFEYRDAMCEIRAFYKIYAEKMRRLDVLNYQTLQAISFGFREMDKEPPNKKSVGWKPLVFARMGECDARKVYADPTQGPIAEMGRDLELIYMGQICLSWEVLVWSYVKARELMQCNSKGRRSYNRAYEEFQQFQVVLQRFMEDEPFQGGGERTVFYAKRRSVVRNLLQVPMIKDDFCKDKKERTTMEETDAISLEALLDAIKESMIVFRDFVHADNRRATHDVLKGVRGNKFDSTKESLDNSRLFAELIEALKKKERRMRESVRRESCVIKKLKKKERRSSNNEVLKSQVYLRLVSRVLSLQKLSRDQMFWCKKKLENIDFLGTNKVVHVVVEPSFSLLPC